MKVEILGRKKEEIRSSYLKAMDQMNLYSRRSTNWAVASFFPIGLGILLIFLSQTFDIEFSIYAGISFSAIGVLFVTISLFYSFKKSDLSDAVRLYEEYYEYAREFKRKKGDKISHHRSSLESDLERMERSWNEVGDEINRVLKEVESKIKENEK